MGTPLRILMVEDEEDDAELLSHELGRGGYEVTRERVDTADALYAALERGAWEIVTCDHAMPRFSAPAALALVREFNPDLPVIIISGEIDLGLAVALMRTGARDYIQKGELAQIVPAIERELHEADVRRERREMEAALRETYELIQAQNEQLQAQREELLAQNEELVVQQEELQQQNGDLRTQEAALHTQAALLRQSEALAHTGSWRLKLDVNRFTASAGALQMCGFPPDYEPTLDEVSALIHPDDHPRVRQALKEALEQQTFGEVVYRLFRREDGALRYIRSKGETCRVENSQVVELFGVNQDVTEHVEAEEALRQSQQLLSAVVESLPQNIYTKDVDGRFLFANQRYCATESKALVDIIGKNDFDLHPPELAIKYRQDDQHVMATGQTLTLEEIHQPLGGPQFYVQAIKAPLYDANAHIIGTLGIFWDITERARAEEARQQADQLIERQNQLLQNQNYQLKFQKQALQQAEADLRQLNAELEQRVAERTGQFEATNRELEAFIHSVSHDLRAPLRRLQGFSEVLQQDCADQLNPQGQTYVQRIAAAAKSMDELIKAMLELSRITQAELQHETVDLSALAQRIAAELQAREPARQVEWQIMPGLTAQADARLITSVLENLLENAWKFTARLPVAQIAVGQAGEAGQPVYFVRDNGAGFNLDEATGLFVPFRRMHSAQEFPGTGIGLATVKRIIQRHGGRVWAESAEAKGATFYFTLGNRDAVAAR